MALLDGKIALITGASRGLGRALGLALGKAGAHIVALARTQGGLADFDDALRKETGRGATLIPLDLAEPDASFAQLGMVLFERFKHLDILALNTAAIGPLSPVAHVKEADLQKIMAVNFTANARLLRHLDPLLRASQSPKVLFLTCGESSRAHSAYWGAYAASKKALEQLALSYKEETEKAGFDVRVIDPGPMATQLRRSAFPGEDQANMQTPEQAAEKIMKGLG
ncbi:MAG TPA: SDR family NAD(P)-dependent oxidoreductase [Alphaproteobacteria bacterium]|nr:SDR family NAD(P)-dependent oxidoreductase [Alphaproteobacteria bacterium]